MATYPYLYDELQKQHLALKEKWEFSENQLQQKINEIQILTNNMKGFKSDFDLGFVDKQQLD